MTAGPSTAGSTTLGWTELALLGQHRVQGVPLLPGLACVGLLLEAARELGAGRVARRTGRSKSTWRTLELGDVPGPDLVRLRGQQLGLGAGRMPQLVAPFAGFFRIGQHPIHRPRRSEVGLFFEQGGVGFHYVTLTDYDPAVGRFLLYETHTADEIAIGLEDLVSVW